jgi:hypothetical protein
MSEEANPRDPAAQTGQSTPAVPSAPDGQSAPAVAMGPEEPSEPESPPADALDAADHDDEAPDSLDAVDLRDLLRTALAPPEPPPPQKMLSGVQRKIRQRSRGRFYGDGWSTSRNPRSTYLVTSALMLVVIALLFLTLVPWSSQLLDSLEPGSGGPGGSGSATPTAR